MFDQPTCYLSPKLEGRTRPDGSNGVYAVEPVEAGETVAVWGGEVISLDQVQQLLPEVRRYSLQIEENLYLVTSRPGPGDWVNHSCEPNAGMQGQVVLVAMRHIFPGEEVCYDYAMTDGSPYDEFRCACGTPTCRQHITGHDWRRPELIQRYQGYFSPYLQRRIAQLQSEAFKNNGHQPGLNRLMPF